MSHISEEQLILYHYGEEGDRGTGEHLSACASCRGEYRRLTETLEVVSASPVPERGEEYGREVFARLRPLLAAEAERRQWNWGGFFQINRWATVGALAALLVAAFFSGRFWQSQVTPRSMRLAMSQGSAQAPERILLVAVGDHLERSQMMLVELTNASDTESPNKMVDISLERQWAQDLVGDNRLYRQTAARTGDIGVNSILEELERFLLDIANSPSKIPSRDLEKLRQRIEEHGLLFKVRVIGSEVREREKVRPGGTDRGSL